MFKFLGAFQYNLTIPLDHFRNVARETAQTHFVFPSDIELYPSPGTIPSFLEMVGLYNSSGTIPSFLDMVGLYTSSGTIPSFLDMVGLYTSSGTMP